MRAIIEDENAEDGVQLRVIIFIIFNIEYKKQLSQVNNVPIQLAVRNWI